MLRRAAVFAGLATNAQGRASIRLRRGAYTAVASQAAYPSDSLRVSAR